MSLTSEAFEKLLAALSSDRERAGEQYELVRLKLVRYFEFRLCDEPDALADDTIDRLARRLAGGERIDAPHIMPYVYGVARNVLLESWKKSERRRQTLLPAISETRLETVDAEEQDKCFHDCLRAIPEPNRDLVLQYYRDRGRAKIDRRSALARQLGIPLNALRIRIHRLKNRLHRCIEDCMRSSS